IVRINRSVRPNHALDSNLSVSDKFFLVEHSRGFFCCRVRLLPNNVIVPFDNGLSFAQVELRFPKDARIWGAVDLEFRPLLDTGDPRVPRDLAKRWKPQPISQEHGFGRMLRTARRRLRMSTREAAGASQAIAKLLSNVRYEISSSSLN